jgi:hypothetical protein
MLSQTGELTERSNSQRVTPMNNMAKSFVEISEWESRKENKDTVR